MALISTGATAALGFGVYEVPRTATSLPSNPFDYALHGFKVTFQRPNGTTIQVDGFYDGGNAYNARCYCDMAGSWSWTATALGFGLAQPTPQAFTVSSAATAFPGKLRADTDGRQFVHDGGEWFIHVGNAAFNLFKQDVPQANWQGYLSQAHQAGFSKLRSWLTNHEDEGDGLPLFEDANPSTRLDLASTAMWRNAEARLVYAAENFPRLQIQVIPFGNDDGFLRRHRTFRTTLALRYAAARWSAFFNVHWCISDDMQLAAETAAPGVHDPAQKVTSQRVKDAGADLRSYDLWGTLIGNLANGNAHLTEPLFAETWLGYQSFEAENFSQSVDGTTIATHRAQAAKPVVNDEDLNETDGADVVPGATDSRYYFRRLMLASLFNGGAATWGGLAPWLAQAAAPSRNGIHPYYTAADDGRLPDGGGTDFHRVRQAFKDRGINLRDTVPMAVATDPVIDQLLVGGASVGKVPLRLSACKKSDDSQYWFYFHNGSESGGNPVAPQSAVMETSAVGIRLKLPQGFYQVRWFNPRTSKWVFTHNSNADNALCDVDTLNGNTSRLLNAPTGSNPNGDWILYVLKWQTTFDRAMKGPLRTHAGLRKERHQGRVADGYGGQGLLENTNPVTGFTTLHPEVKLDMAITILAHDMTVPSWINIQGMIFPTAYEYIRSFRPKAYILEYCNGYNFAGNIFHNPPGTNLFRYTVPIWGDNDVGANQVNTDQPTWFLHDPHTSQLVDRRYNNDAAPLSANPGNSPNYYRKLAMRTFFVQMVMRAILGGGNGKGCDGFWIDNNGIRDTPSPTFHPDAAGPPKITPLNPATGADYTGREAGIEIKALTDEILTAIEALYGTSRITPHGSGKMIILAPNAGGEVDAFTPTSEGASLREYEDQIVNTRVTYPESPGFIVPNRGNQHANLVSPTGTPAWNEAKWRNDIGLGADSSTIIGDKGIRHILQAGHMFIYRSKPTVDGSGIAGADAIWPGDSRVYFVYGSLLLAGGDQSFHDKFFVKNESNDEGFWEGFDVLMGWATAPAVESFAGFSGLYARSYDNGLVLVNPTGTAKNNVTHGVTKPYRVMQDNGQGGQKMRAGWQGPAVESVGTMITVPAYSARVLYWEPEPTITVPASAGTVQTFAATLDAIVGISAILTTTGAGQVFLDEQFSSPLSGDWVQNDDPGLPVAGAWSVAAGELRQTANAGIGTPTAPAGDWHARDITRLYYAPGLSWSNYRVRVRRKSTDDDGILLLFRYQDANNHYGIIEDNQLIQRGVFKRVAGLRLPVTTNDTMPYVVGTYNEITVEVSGVSFVVLFDGTPVFEGVIDAAIASGTIALGAWRNNGAFWDYVTVEFLGNTQDFAATLTAQSDATADLKRAVLFVPAPSPGPIITESRDAASIVPIEAGWVVVGAATALAAVSSQGNDTSYIHQQIAFNQLVEFDMIAHSSYPEEEYTELYFGLRWKTVGPATTADVSVILNDVVHTIPGVAIGSTFNNDFIPFPVPGTTSFVWTRSQANAARFAVLAGQGVQISFAIRQVRHREIFSHSQMSASIDVDSGFAAKLVATSGASAQLLRAVRFAATPTATSAFSAALSRIRGFSETIDFTRIYAAAMIVGRDMRSTIGAQSAFLPALSRGVPLSATLGALSDMAADLKIVPLGVADMVAKIEAASEFAAGLNVARDFSAIEQASSAMVAEILRMLSFAAELFASSAALAEQVVDRSFAAVMEAQATISASLEVSASFDATLEAQMLMVATMKVDNGFFAAIDTASVFAAVDVLVSRSLAADLAAQSGIVANWDVASKFYFKVSDDIDRWQRPSEGALLNPSGAVVVVR